MTGELLQAMIRHQEDGRPFVLATQLANGAQRIIEPGEALDDWGGEQVTQVLLADEAAVVGEGPSAVFLRPYNPPPHIVITGAVHIAQGLVKLAELTGFRCTIVDPREAFATEHRFPTSTVLADWPDQVLPHIPFSTRTGLVALTHDPKIDDPALIHALHSRAFYIGALGGRKTQASRRERMTAEGFGPDDVARIRGPVGLPIGARTPEEIAVAIMAEIIDALRNPGQPRLDR